MLRGNRELWFAFLAMILITALYALVVTTTREIPPAGELFGHGMGIFGFILMLSTETLYSLRKRSRTVRWGKMSIWLQFHIFTGLVGPYMVLLHTSWKFNGLAGATTLLTMIIVVSGFIGRYIYTRIPAHNGWAFDRRDIITGSPQTGAPHDGTLAHHPCSHWCGAVYFSIHPHRRSSVLRHIFEVI